MITEKIIIPIPLGILNALEAYEVQSTQPDSSKLESMFDVHDLDNSPYEIEVEYPTENVERILVSDLIVKAYLAGIDKGLQKAAAIEQDELSKDNLELYRSRI